MKQMTEALEKQQKNQIRTIKIKGTGQPSVVCSSRWARWHDFNCCCCVYTGWAPLRRMCTLRGAVPTLQSLNVSPSWVTKLKDLEEL